MSVCIYACTKRGAIHPCMHLFMHVYVCMSPRTRVAHEKDGLRLHVVARVGPEHAVPAYGKEGGGQGLCGETERQSGRVVDSPSPDTGARAEGRESTYRVMRGMLRVK